MADLFYRDPLYDLTLKLVPLWQAGHTKEDYTVEFLKTMTMFGEGYAAAFFFTLCFVCMSRDKSFYILVVACGTITVNKYMKIIYRNPRPYMVDDEIAAFGCSKGFGNPSGHSSLSATLYPSIFLLIFHDVDYYRIALMPTSI